MNAEKSRGMFLAVLFGVMGLTLLILAWLIPVDASNRITAAIMGSAGIFGAAVRIPMLKKTAKKDLKSLTVKAEAEKEA